jgi:hypothetical protein
MKRRNRILLLLLAAVLLLAFTLTTRAETQSLSLAWWSLSSSGGGSFQAGNTTLTASIGQPVAGEMASPPLQLCTGFQCAADRLARIYLPLLRR